MYQCVDIKDWTANYSVHYDIYLVTLNPSEEIKIVKEYMSAINFWETYPLEYTGCNML